MPRAARSARRRELRRLILSLLVGSVALVAGCDILRLSLLPNREARRQREFGGSPEQV